MSAPFRPGPAEPVIWWQAVETVRALDDAQAAADALAAWLTPPERVALAAGALRALSPAAAEALCEAFVAELRAGEPVAAFVGLLDEAEAWAAMASPAEIKAYAWSAFMALPASSRAQFIATAYHQAAAGEEPE